MALTEIWIVKIMVSTREEAEAVNKAVREIDLAAGTNIILATKIEPGFVCPEDEYEALPDVLKEITSVDGRIEQPEEREPDGKLN